jgi:glutaredoxin 3
VRRRRYHIAIDPNFAAEFPVSQHSPPITIYSTAICPYCVAAKNFLKSQGREWTEVRVDLDLEERRKMIDLARRTSVPQIFVGDVHVGGYDDMMALHRKGGLLPLLDGQGVGGQAPEASA